MILSLKLLMRNVMLQNSINLMVKPESPRWTFLCPPRLRIFVKTFHYSNYCQRCHYYRRYRNSVLSLVIWLFSQNNQPTLDWKFKNEWTKRLQKIPRKINLSLSLAKRKLAEKNEWNLSDQSGEVTHASIYLTNYRRSFIFSSYLI